VDDISKDKYFALVEFPYPSGAALHMGHGITYSANDILARYKLARGYNVLSPIG
jgi:leucyl-tRNA synthetase